MLLSIFIFIILLGRNYLNKDSERYRLHASAMLLVYILPKNYLEKSWIFFEDL